MGNLVNILITLVLLLFFIFTTPSTAYIKSHKIRSNDHKVIDFDQFKFTQTGHLSVAISSVSVTSSMPVTSNLSQPDPSRFGFFLYSDDAIEYIDSESSSCYLDSKYITLLFTFNDLSSQSSFNKSYNVTYPNLYTLQFANCNPLTHVTMDVRTELYNTINGDTKDYLSAGEPNLSRFYFKFSLIYLFYLGLWILVCFTNYSSLHWIHILMGVFLLMKGLNLFFAAKVEHFFKFTGTPPHHESNYVLLYVFQYIRYVLFYTVIAVIIDGCCFLNREIRVTVGLIIAIPLQILATIASKLEREDMAEDPSGWESWLVFADTFCRFGFIFLIGCVFCNTAVKNDTGVKNHSGKFTLILVFSIVFIVYTCIDFVCEAVGRDWAKVSETASVVLYVVMFLVFMPSQKTQYFIPPTPVAPVPDVEFGCRV